MQCALEYIFVMWNLRTDNTTKGCLEGMSPQFFKALKSEVQVVTIGQTVVFDRTWIHLELNKKW